MSDNIDGKELFLRSNGFLNILLNFDFPECKVPWAGTFVQGEMEAYRMNFKIITQQWVSKSTLQGKLIKKEIIYFLRTFKISIGPVCLVLTYFKWRQRTPERFA